MAKRKRAAHKKGKTKKRKNPRRRAAAKAAHRVGGRFAPRRAAHKKHGKKAHKRRAGGKRAARKAHRPKHRRAAHHGGSMGPIARRQYNLAVQKLVAKGYTEADAKRIVDRAMNVGKIRHARTASEAEAAAKSAAAHQHMGAFGEMFGRIAKAQALGL
jgi:hypothetical protein